PIHDGGTYVATQGPRLESAAEIKRMAQDGCTLVGMTGMPEAGLARELGIAYASLCLVANWAAGITSDVIKFSEIASTLGQGVGGIHNIFNHVIENFGD
ncbi:MAG: S-methyl-5'-thioadenosine phosphorylase, partial [Gammaproteobacteria bacterium]